jgi:hypothetical protein
MPTVAQIVSLYPIAQYLCQNDIDDNGLYAKGVNVQLPQKIRNIGDSVARIYNADPTDETLPLTANYLWTLCGKWGQQAQSVTQSAGSIPSITPSAGLPEPLDWIVSPTSSPLANGDTTVTFDGTGGLPDLRGYNISFIRGGLVQYTTDPGDGSTYYSWDRTNAVFTISAAANTGEQLRIEILS